MVIKKGDTGELVKIIQRELNLNDDGVFGGDTEKSVINFQRSKGLVPDGVVGKNTWEALGLDTDQMYVSIPDTDDILNYKGKYTTKDGLIIDKVYLDDNEYVTDYGEIPLKGFFIHHTAGWDNPYNTVNDWNRDSRGRVATQYIIGGSNILNTDNKYDGDVIECFPNNYNAWHLGGVGNVNIHIYSGGVELCNFGFLYEKNGKFYPYVAKKNGQWRPDYHKYEVQKEYVCDLGYKFRGFRYWHKYTDKQIENLRLLILHLKEIYPKMDFMNGLPQLLKSGIDPKDAFEFNNDAYYAKQFGLWSHSNVRKDKFDCSPQPKLVEMLKKL